MNISYFLYHYFTLNTLTLFLNHKKFPWPIMNSVRRLYRGVGSGDSHAPFSKFSEQSSKENNRKPIGLLCGASSRITTFLYSINCPLRIMKPLTDTINLYPCKGIKLTKR